MGFRYVCSYSFKKGRGRKKLEQLSEEDNEEKGDLGNLAIEVSQPDGQASQDHLAVPVGVSNRQDSARDLIPGIIDLTAETNVDSLPSDTLQVVPNSDDGSGTSDGVRIMGFWGSFALFDFVSREVAQRERVFPILTSGSLGLNVAANVNVQFRSCVDECLTTPIMSLDSL